jgi:Flp pilus assembly protein TadG
MGVEVKNQRGAAAVEFAIVLPILVLLVFGIMEISFALYDKAMITNASREGARAGIVFRVPPVTDEEIVDIVNRYLGNHLITFGTPINATTAITRTDSTPGDELQVTVVYTYSSLVLPSFIASFGGSLNMMASTTMRME